MILAIVLTVPFVTLAALIIRDPANLRGTTDTQEG